MSSTVMVNIGRDGEETQLKKLGSMEQWQVLKAWVGPVPLSPNHPDQHNSEAGWREILNATVDRVHKGQRFAGEGGGGTPELVETRRRMGMDEQTLQRKTEGEEGYLVSEEVKPDQALRFMRHAVKECNTQGRNDFVKRPGGGQEINLWLESLWIDSGRDHR